MKRYGKESGLTLVELMMAAAIGAAVLGLAYKLIATQQQAALVEANRINARTTARSAVMFLKDIFRKAEGTQVGGVWTYVNINDSSALRSFDIGASGSASFASVANTCVSSPGGKVIEPPPYVGFLESGAICPQACGAGQVPQIKVTYQNNGVSATRFFPSNFDGLTGAIACSKRVPAPITFPANLRAQSFALTIYVGWDAKKVGTPQNSLWVVDGAFLSKETDSYVQILGRSAN